MYRDSVKEAFAPKKSTAEGPDSLSQELDETINRHLDGYATLAESARPHLDGSQATEWMDRLAADGFSGLAIEAVTNVVRLDTSIATPLRIPTHPPVRMKVLRSLTARSLRIAQASPVGWWIPS